MEQYFMSRTSAVALLVDTRRAAVAESADKAEHEAQDRERLVKDLERLLLDVRVGRTSEFSLDFPSRIHVIVSD
ncbi:hypothetical protein WKR88_01530 [Trinickia caryophylli]|nr:hypothetical protein [Trinickia caryophylli]TRX19928.1 hypothetical protein FNF07_18120 [Trinickia caryophylli]WQE12737.1 hypothetical protein U0034_04835 [Trinickia caryophylli]GLU30444.1 hypothetical protein Busp01_02860 [Trinickia caryophylli]